MNACGRCGTGQTPGTRYCTACGADLASWSVRNRSDAPPLPLPLVVTAVVVVAVTLVAASVVAVRYSNRRVTGVATAAEAGVATLQVPTWTWTPPPVTTTTTGAVPPDEVARRNLDARVAADRAAVESLVDRWVPQLSSKRVGLVVHGVRFTHEDIWRDFQLTEARYPNALLLSSADYVSFDSGDFWVTVVPHAYTTGAEANAWCDRERIGPDDCFAKRLTHTGTSDGTTVFRR